MLNIWPGSSPPKKLLRIFTRLHWKCILWLCWTFVHLRGNKKAWESPRTGRDTGQPAWLHTQHLASHSLPRAGFFLGFHKLPREHTLVQTSLLIPSYLKIYESISPQQTSSLPPHYLPIWSSFKKLSDCHSALNHKQIQCKKPIQR